MKREGKDKYGNKRQAKLSVINDNEIDRKKGQGSHEVHKIDTPEYQALIDRVYQYIKDGFSSTEIYATLILEDDEMTETIFIKTLKLAYEYGENQLHKDREYIFQLHMDRYEKIYQQSIVLENSWHRPLDPIKDWTLITMRYAQAMEALKNKEKLIGLHDKSVVIELNDQKATLIEPDNERGGVPGFDLTKLNMQQKKEMLQLVTEARTTPIEGIQRVEIKRTTIQIDMNTGDRTKSVTVTNVDNVSSVTFEEMPKNVVKDFQDITPISVEDMPAKDPIIDSVPKQLREQNKAGSDLLSKFRKTLQNSRK